MKILSLPLITVFLSFNSYADQKVVRFQCGSPHSIIFKEKKTSSELKLTLKRVSEFTWNSEAKNNQVISTQKEIESEVVISIKESDPQLRLELKKTSDTYQSAESFNSSADIDSPRRVCKIISINISALERSNKDFDPNGPISPALMELKDAFTVVYFLSAAPFNWKTADEAQRAHPELF